MRRRLGRGADGRHRGKLLRGKGIGGGITLDRKIRVGGIGLRSGILLRRGIDIGLGGGKIA